MAGKAVLLMRFCGCICWARGGEAVECGGFLGSARLVVGMGLFGETVFGTLRVRGWPLVFLFFYKVMDGRRGGSDRGWKLWLGSAIFRV